MAVLVVRKIAAASTSTSATTSSGDVAPGAPCKPRRVSIHASDASHAAGTARAVRPATTPFQPASTIATTWSISRASISAPTRRRASTSSVPISSHVQPNKRSTFTSGVRPPLAIQRTYTPPLLLPYNPTDPFTLPTRRKPRRMSGTYDSDASEFLPESGSSSPVSARNRGVLRTVKRMAATAARNKESRKTVLGKRKREASKAAAVSGRDSEEETDYNEVPKTNATATKVKGKMKDASRASLPLVQHPAKRHASASALSRSRHQRQPDQADDARRTVVHRSTAHHTSPPSSDENLSTRSEVSTRRERASSLRLSDPYETKLHKPTTREPLKPFNAQGSPALTKSARMVIYYDESSDPLDCLS